MRMTGNTILITGGGTGIGRGLAEALHAKGNQVIIAGRRQHALDAVTAANPGMASIRLDIADPASIAAVAARVVADFPALDVLINCAGIQHVDNAAGPIDDGDLVLTISINLLGPIRMTSALIKHLHSRPSAVIAHVSSMLGYLPKADIAVYSATKAALHSFTLSQRYMLQGSSIDVLEIAPPYVQTDLLDGAEDPRAMKLDDYIAQTMAALATDDPDVLVEFAKARRDGLNRNDSEAVVRFNDLFR